MWPLRPRERTSTAPSRVIKMPSLLSDSPAHQPALKTTSEPRGQVHQHFLPESGSGPERSATPQTHTPTTHTHVHRLSHACDPSSLRSRGICSLPPSPAHVLSDQRTSPQTLQAHKDLPGDGPILTSGEAPSGWPRRPVSVCWSLGRREGTGPYTQPWGRKWESTANTPNNPPG